MYYARETPWLDGSFHDQCLKPVRRSMCEMCHDVMVLVKVLRRVVEYLCAVFVRVYQ